MKKLYLFILPFIIGMLAACSNGQLSISQASIDKLEQIKHEDKFGKVKQSILSNPKLNDSISVLINKSADDFIATAKDAPTTDKFQTTMRKALAHFSYIYSELDTQNKGLIAGYVQQMMDIVGAEDKEGVLHKWTYGLINAGDESN